MMIGLLYISSLPPSLPSYSIKQKHLLLDLLLLCSQCISCRCCCCCLHVYVPIPKYPFLILGELATVSNDNLFTGSTIAWTNSLDGLDHIHALGDATEDLRKRKRQGKKEKGIETQKYEQAEDLICIYIYNIYCERYNIYIYINIIYISSAS